MIGKTKRMFVMDCGSVEKGRQPSPRLRQTGQQRWPAFSLAAKASSLINGLSALKFLLRCGGSALQCQNQPLTDWRYDDSMIDHHFVRRQLDGHNHDFTKIPNCDSQGSTGKASPESSTTFTGGRKRRSHYPGAGSTTQKSQGITQGNVQDRPS